MADDGGTSAERWAARLAWAACRRGIAAAALGYLTLTASAMLLENTLVYPRPPRDDGDWRADHYGAREVWFPAADGVRLNGWLFACEAPRAHVVFFHGNGEHLGYLGGHLSELSRRARVVLLGVDYRGYGRSEGRPSEPGLLADGRGARRALAQHCRLRPEQIVLMGRSLGGAVAVDAAAAGARGLILESTFPALPDVAARFYPWLPVRWLMRNRFDSLDKIGAYQGALLQLHGDGDEIVPLAMARRLFDASPSPDKRFVVLPGMGHNDPPPEAYYEAIDRFLDSLPPLNPSAAAPDADTLPPGDGSPAPNVPGDPPH